MMMSVDLRRRQGRGKPLPVSPTPGLIAATVHGMGETPGKKIVPGTSPVRHQPHQGKNAVYA